MSEPFIGEVKMFSGDLAPIGYAMCDGAVLPVAQYSALVSLIGRLYGGNGVIEVALPDLRGRVPVNFGQAPGLANRPIGSNGGAENQFHQVLPDVANSCATPDAKSAAAHIGSNMPPFLCVKFIIALAGIYPARA